MTAQTRINEIQAVYKEWLALHERLETAKQDLAKSAELMGKLEDFYFDGEWRELYEKIENGEQFDLTTDGEYSVMSEDTIWNAIHDHDSTLWDFMRFCVKHLDKAGE
ncbi:DUF4298 domain-containing protein [Moraxella nasicaprae]|uniref:DUF4298 domain-containing protein n=1 Tax=Moraxella nasicaprae TaxID=2904122 RepID=A0ABY6F2T3_9GAMM|nr:DUF4298 domain-containing protein [Moraxella nasicaprae]UXZ04403.1 DUF4298 domain-containing protein [Moraxella nasicaprae]